MKKNDILIAHGSDACGMALEIAKCVDDVDFLIKQCR